MLKNMHYILYKLIYIFFQLNVQSLKETFVKTTNKGEKVNLDAPREIMEINIHKLKNLRLFFSRIKTAILYEIFLIYICY